MLRAPSETKNSSQPNSNVRLLAKGIMSLFGESVSERRSYNVLHLNTEMQERKKHHAGDWNLTSSNPRNRASTEVNKKTEVTRLGNA